MIKILQVNLGIGRNAQDLMIQKLLESNTDIALVSEPYKTLDSLIWFEDATKRAAIQILDNSVNITEVSEENEGFVFVTLNGIRIYSCYFPPSMENDIFE